MGADCVVVEEEAAQATVPDQPAGSIKLGDHRLAGTHSVEEPKLQLPAQHRDMMTSGIAEGAADGPTPYTDLHTSEASL